MLQSRYGGCAFYGICYNKVMPGENEARITIRLTPDQLSLITRWAHLAGISAHAFARQSLINGIRHTAAFYGLDGSEINGGHSKDAASHHVDTQKS